MVLDRCLSACLLAQVAVWAVAVGAGLWFGQGAFPLALLPGTSEEPVSVLSSLFEILFHNLWSAVVLAGVCLFTLGIGGALMLGFNGYLFGATVPKLAWIILYAVPEFLSFCLVAAVSMRTSVYCAYWLATSEPVAPTVWRNLGVWFVVAVVGIMILNAA